MEADRCADNRRRLQGRTSVQRYYHHLRDPFINGKIAAKDWFQPQIGATYRVGRQEFFANYAENMRAYISSFRGPFGTTQAGFEAIRGVLKPETSRTIEGAGGSMPARYAACWRSTM